VTPGIVVISILAALAATLPGGGTPAAVEPVLTDIPVARDTVSMPIGREAVEALEFPPLVFDPPEADEYEVLGVPVYHLHDPALPLVDFFVQLRGGLGHLPREEMAAAVALPSLLRAGGTESLPPDSLDLRIDLLALQLSISAGAGGMSAGINSLTETFDEGLALLRDVILRPGFDGEAVEVWRGQEVEWIRRREDDPGGLAVSEFNRLMFGDHPTGWTLVEEDLSEEQVSPERLRDLHGRLVCRDRLIVGISGDLSWEEAESRLHAFLEPWPECSEPLPDPPLPEIRAEGGIFILPRPIEQSTVIIAQPGGILQEDSPDFFASRIANHLLGGSGLTSRIMSRVRTEQGLAYGASSLWTASRRHEGLLGAMTATRPERTMEATRLLLEILEEFSGEEPSRTEVDDALEEIVNGYVFAFESASQIVARRMGYRAQDLPAGWLERYLEGLQDVTPEAIARVTGEHLDVSRMTMLIVGDPDRFDPGLEELGPLYLLSSDGSWTPWVSSP